MYSLALSWFKRYDGGCLALFAKIWVWYAGKLRNRCKLIDYCEQALPIRLKGTAPGKNRWKLIEYRMKRRLREERAQLIWTKARLPHGAEQLWLAKLAARESLHLVVRGCKNREAL